MKLSSIMCASIVALAALALTAQGVSATAKIKSTTSNASYKIGTAAGTTEADCTKAGGKVTDGRDGKMCRLAAGEDPRGVKTGNTGGTSPAPTDATAGSTSCSTMKCNTGYHCEEKPQAICVQDIQTGPATPSPQ